MGAPALGPIGVEEPVLMKICVLIPSAKYRSSAGSRIRYLRIEKMLQALGHSLKLLPIEEFKTRHTEEFDTFILSKCYDTRGLSTAKIIHVSGKIVGIDLFDDNFSQILDSRLLQQRSWMSAINASVDFALCSTPTMAGVAAHFWPGKPSHVMNDPFIITEMNDLAAKLGRKFQHATESKRLGVAWFGQGDNPRFPVGLRDLDAFGEAIGQLAGNHVVDVTVLTNRRSLTAAGFERINSLPATVSVQEWSEAKEHQILDEALIAFIPVNAQPFSIAKSMNRALTALTAGAQILSTGYPLYEALNDFIYASSKALVSDLARGELRMRPQVIPELAKRMTQLGNPAIEAAQLATFLSSLLALKSTFSDTSAPMSPLGVLHGVSSPNDCHRSIQKLGHFSIAGPFSRSGPRYDLWIEGEQGVSAINFSERLLPHLKDEFRAFLAFHTLEGRDEIICRIPLSALASETEIDLLRPHPLERITSALPGYKAVMAKMTEICKRLVPSMDVMVSEGDAAFTALLWQEKAQ